MVSQHENFALPLRQDTTQLLEPEPQLGAAELVFGRRIARPKRQPADQPVPPPARVRPPTTRRLAGRPRP